MRVDLTEDPAVIAIAAALQVHETHVVGMLHKVWSWADCHADVRDLSAFGHAPVVSLSWLDRHVGVTGLGQAMVDVGWLVVDNGLKFPNFTRHNGESAKKRAMDTERKRAARNPSNVQEMSAKESDKNRTREEKRRSKPPVVPQPGFERFWTAWPPGERKQAKGECEKKWRLKGCEAEAEMVLAHIEAMKSSADWQQGFIPAPLVYLNQRRWQGASAKPIKREARFPI